MDFSSLFVLAEGCLTTFAATATASVALQNLLLVALLLWATDAWRKGLRPTLPNRFFTWATILFLASFFLSAALGLDPRESFNSVHKYLILLVMFPLAAMGLRSSKALRQLYVFTAGTSVCALWGIYKHFFGFNDETSSSSLARAFKHAFVHEERIRSFSGHYMVFGGLLMLGVLLSIFFLKKNPGDRWNWVFLVLNSSALILTQTRGAWLGLAAGFLVWGFFTNRKWLMIGLTAMAAGFLLVPTAARDRIFNILKQNETFQHSSDTERLYIWQTGLHIVRDHPVFGIGQGLIEKVYPAYKNPNAMEANVGHMHNNFVQIAVQNGLVGLATFLLWLVAYFWTVFHHKPKDPSDAALHFMLTCTFIASMVWGLTEYTFSYQFMSVQAFLMGIQLSLERRSITNA
jgi:O-antigen ligase